MSTGIVAEDRECVLVGNGSVAVTQALNCHSLKLSLITNGSFDSITSGSTSTMASKREPIEHS